MTGLYDTLYLSLDLSRIILVGETARSISFSSASPRSERTDLTVKSSTYIFYILLQSIGKKSTDTQVAVTVLTVLRVVVWHTACSTRIQNTAYAASSGWLVVSNKKRPYCGQFD